MFSEKTAQAIRSSGVIPVVVIEDASKAVPLANALLEGGINAIEITLRTAAGLEAMRRIRQEAPEMLLGAGTVLTPDQARQSAEAGATFGVAPGCDPDVVNAAKDAGLDFAPGIMTPSDVSTALKLGCVSLKFFPAESAGGVSHLKSLAAPFVHLGVQFVPTGGISEKTVAGYLSLPYVLAVGGSWLTPKSLVNEDKWSEIAKLASHANAAAKAARP